MQLATIAISDPETFKGMVTELWEVAAQGDEAGDAYTLGEYRKLDPGPIEEWLLSAEYILAGGNGQVILCERGIRTFENYTRNTLDISAIPVVKKRSHLPIVVDPSHGTGRRGLVAAMARAGLVGRSSLEELAVAVLGPFRAAPLTQDSGLPELVTFEPPLRIRLDAGELPSIRSGDAPEAITRALMDGDAKWGLDVVALRPRIVREPQLRELVETMQRRSIGLVLPSVHQEHLEAVLMLPLEERADALEEEPRSTRDRKGHVEFTRHPAWPPLARGTCAA